MSKFGNLRFLAANTFADAWNKAEAGYTYFIDITSNTDPPTTAANRWFGQMWKNDTGKYGWQVAWSFNGTIYKRERNNSDAWTDWNTYALKSDFVIKTYTIAGKAVNAETTADFEPNIALSGYTPLGIVGTCLNAYGSVTLVYAYLVDDTKARVRVRNNGTESVTGDNVIIRVLYFKS